MSQLIINRPIRLVMEVLDVDSYLPSIKMFVAAEIIHPTGNFIYQANDIWFNCSEWDDFNVRLNKSNVGDKSMISLRDMSEKVEFGIETDLNLTSFCFKCKEVNASNGIVNLHFKGTIDSEVFYSIKNAFNAFEKCW